MWGQVFFVSNGNRRKRIIPTRVGTRQNGNVIPAFTEDHPHACGDKEMSGLLTVSNVGSSPRVWGQVNSMTIFLRCMGIIPTRVGTRSLHIMTYFIFQDHPHACGDKLGRFFLVAFIKGSSPRVWGQGFYLKYGKLPFRIIPTRVGTRNTLI